MITLPQDILDILPPIGSQRDSSDPKAYFKLYISRTGGAVSETLVEPQELFIWFVLEGEKRGDDYFLYTYNFLEDRFEEVEVSKLDEFSKKLDRWNINYEEDHLIPSPLFRSILEHVTEMLMQPDILSIREAQRYCSFLKVKPIPEELICAWSNFKDASIKYGYNFARYLHTDNAGSGIHIKELISYLQDELPFHANRPANGMNYYRANVLALRDTVLERDNLPDVMDFYDQNKGKLLNRLNFK